MQTVEGHYLASMPRGQDLQDDDKVQVFHVSRTHAEATAVHDPCEFQRLSDVNYLVRDLHVHVCEEW